MDPITLAQDSKDSWATHISATIVDQTTQTSSVLVKLGPTTD